MIGWLNDLVDRERDREGGETDKPLAAGQRHAGNAVVRPGVRRLVLVPLSLTNGVTAGSFYLAASRVGLLGNVMLRRSWLSLCRGRRRSRCPAFLSYGGWGGGLAGAPAAHRSSSWPRCSGVGVHFLGALPDLVVDDRVGLSPPAAAPRPAHRGARLLCSPALPGRGGLLVAPVGVGSAWSEPSVVAPISSIVRQKPLTELARSRLPERTSC